MLPPEQITNNRAAAVVAVRVALGLDTKAPADWSYDERTTYNKALATYIAARPEQFSDQDLTTAEYVSKSAVTPLADDSFDWGMFASESVRPVAEAAQSVGNGVLTTVNAAKWVIPLAALGVGLLLFLSLNKKLGSPLPIPVPKP